MSAPASGPGAATDADGPPRGRLFRKYIALFVAVVCVALVTNGLFDIWFSYQEQKALLVRIQREQAESVAAKISQFVREIEGQMAWATQLPWGDGTRDEWRFGVVRLLRQVPAVSEVMQLDAVGREQFRMSRQAMDEVGTQSDFSQDPAFVGAMAGKVYFGPVYFVRESEPYMTLAMAGIRRDYGAIVAQVNLKFIWDVVSQIKVGNHGEAYVVDAHLDQDRRRARGAGRAIQQHGDPAAGFVCHARAQGRGAHASARSRQPRQIPFPGGGEPRPAPASPCIGPVRGATARSYAGR
jgi:two-component system, NtrC family, sensor kinase